MRNQIPMLNDVVNCEAVFLHFLTNRHFPASFCFSRATSCTTIFDLTQKILTMNT